MNLSKNVRTVVNQANLSLTTLSGQDTRIVVMRNLRQKAQRVRPRDGQTRNLGDIISVRTGGVLVRGISGGCGVAGIEGDKLDRSALHRGRVAGGAVGVGVVAIFYCNAAIIARVGVDEDSCCSQILCPFDL